MGFDFVQLNTNGLRLAKESDYAQRLVDSGLDCVFLQFDGVSDGVYQSIRGARLLTIKKTAILRCADAGLGVCWCRRWCQASTSAKLAPSSSSLSHGRR